MAGKMLKITQIRSVIGCTTYQRNVLKGLGLRKLNHTVTRLDTQEIRGMIKKISHLLQWEALDSPKSKPSKKKE